MRDADTSVRLPANRRSVTSAALLTQLAREHGLPADRCLRGTGLRPADLSDPAVEIDAGQELALIGNLVRGLAHVPGLGLVAGRRYHLTSYGLLGLAAISSPTLGQAIETGLRFLDLTFMFVPFVVERSRFGLTAVLDERALPTGIAPDIARFLAERETAAVVTYIRDLVGTGQPVSHLEFRHPEPAYAPVYAQILGVRPVFGQPVTCGVVPAKTLGTPLPQAEPRTAELSRRHCEQRRDELRRPAPASVAEAVRDRLRRDLELGAGLPAQGQTAAGLNLSERSLRRALAAEGTSFGALVAEVAGGFAGRMLADGHSVEAVADALGYAATSAFRHAFKRWTGVPPGSCSKNSP
ncbi:AraC family transcriptional regulator [Kutzneria sp. CA-103260]|uniref:AraC family transcriptional regulator n=1 Tax=Kutzneria sp. CA-103260 TaxID=2802641 RepID=UPI001BA74ED4|nr:AraC family transcriptional regulator [Kutzneria sp. CA-103260]QUQ65568.1 AraC family transcriptional regulator [Kutzneria sp. CA-103260]